MRLMLAAIVLLQFPVGSQVPGPGIVMAPTPRTVPFPFPSDVTPPVIHSVKWKTSDAIAALLAMGTGNDWIFTVNASDNTSVVSALLSSDGKPLAWQGSQNALPATFTIHFAEKSLAAGSHEFILRVFDGQGNLAESRWRMNR